MRKRKKILGGLLAVALLVPTLMGCGDKAEESSGTGGSSGSGSEQGSESSEEPSSQASEQESSAAEDAEPTEEITISASEWPTNADPDRLALFESYAETMKELYPNITIVPDEYVYSVDTFLPKAASGQLPTVYRTYFTETSKIINAGYARDITAVLQETGYDKMLNKDLLDLMTSDGKIYGMPHSAYHIGMLYNIELFKEAGLVDENGVPQYAQTYDELAELAVTIKEKTGKPGLFWYTKNNQGGWMFMNLAWSFGVDFMRQEGDKWIATFDSEEAIEAMQFVKDLKWEYDCIQENTLVDGNDMFTMFATNQVAMAYSSLDWNDPIVVSGGADKDNLSMARVPAGPAGRCSLMGGSVYMFSPTATDEEVAAALKWLEVTGYSPNVSDEMKKGIEDIQKTFASEGIPVGPKRINVWSAGEYYDVETKAISDNTNVDMKFWEDYAIIDDVSIHPEVPVNAQELYKALDDVIQEVLTNENADVAALMKAANDTFQKDYLDNVQ